MAEPPAGRAVVRSLHIYPVKALAGVSIDSFEVLPAGPRHDRRYMLVDADGVFITQRTAPRLALVRVTVAESGLECDAPGMPTLRVARPDESKPEDAAPRVRAAVWRSELALPVVAGATEWFSDWLSAPCRLVYLPDDVHRTMNPDFARPHERVSLADGYPLLVASSSSLRHLEAAAGVPFDMRRFRPNVVVDAHPESALPPWAELQWGRAELGPHVTARHTKPCVRCAVTMVDPNRGVASGKEPLRTLARLQRNRQPGVEGDGAVFGINLVPEAFGTIRVGDTVTWHRRERPESLAWVGK